MVEHHEITRRGMLAGTGTVIASTAIGWAALPIIQSAGQAPASEVEEAITAHRLAVAALNEAQSEQEQIEKALWANPRYIAWPHVQYGRLIVGTNEDGSRRYQPLHAGSLAYLDELCAKDCSSISMIFGDAGIERTKAKFAALKHDLSLQIRRKKYHDRKAGLPEAEARCSRALYGLDAASVRVLLARPKDQAEADHKSEYMRGQETFSADYWDATQLLRHIKSQLGIAAA